MGLFLTVVRQISRILHTLISCLSVAPEFNNPQKAVWLFIANEFLSKLSREFKRCGVLKKEKTDCKLKINIGISCFSSLIIKKLIFGVIVAKGSQFPFTCQQLKILEFLRRYVPVDWHSSIIFSKHFGHTSWSHSPLEGNPFSGVPSQPSCPLHWAAYNTLFDHRRRFTDVHPP